MLARVGYFAEAGNENLAETETSAAAGQFQQPLLGILPAALVGLARHRLAVQLDGPGPLHEGLLVQPGRTQPGVELGGRVPLEAALEVEDGPLRLFENLALVEVAELVGGVAAAVALGVVR